MNKLALYGGLSVALAAGIVATLETAGRTIGASPVSALQSVNCASISGINCLTEAGGGRLQVTTRATPAPSSTPAPAPRSTTVRSSGGTTHVNVSGSSTQTSSTGTVIVEQNSQSASSRGHASNTSRSTTNITITNH